MIEQQAVSGIGRCMEPVADPAREPGLHQGVQPVSISVLEDHHRFPPQVLDGEDRHRHRAVCGVRVNAQMLRPHAEGCRTGSTGGAVRLDGEVPGGEPGAAVLRGDFTLDQVHRGRAHEPGDEEGGRTVVNLVRRADLLQPAFLHDRDAVAHGHRLHLVVG